MAQNKIYGFARGNTIFSNASVIEAIGQNPWVVQVNMVIAAPTKERAIELLDSVGATVRQQELRLDKSSSVQKMKDQGLLSNETVLVWSMDGRSNDPIVELTPGAKRHLPEFKQVGTVAY